MKRYAVSRIIGDGQSDETSFRPALALVPMLSWGVTIAPDQFNNPNKQWVLCVIAGTQAMFDAVNAQADSAVLDFGPNERGNAWLSVGNQQYRQALVEGVKSRTGYDILRDDPRTVGEVITDLGRALDTNFHADNMDIYDDFG